ncbi:MAG: phage tail protein [Lysobacterales bacterium]
MRIIKTLTVLLFVAGTALIAAPVQAKDSPYGNFNFTVVIDGTRLGGFTEVSGLATETDVVEYREGSESGEVTRKIPGRHTYSNITLKRGIISGNTDLWDWRQMVIDGDIENARMNGSIIMYDQDMQPVAVWHFENGWPSKVVGPSQKSDDKDIALEELTIAHEYIVRIK